VICGIFQDSTGGWRTPSEAHGRAGDWFHAWRPLIVQYVSPQVWASRPGRAATMARTMIFFSAPSFELEWYRRHAPRLPVEFVGNPIMDRYAE